MPILYNAWLNLPDVLLTLIHNSDVNLHKLLSATKIGQTENVRSLHLKMQKLQTYIPFVTIKYVGIEHEHHAKTAETAMHMLFREYHLAGEWYDMSVARRQRLLDKFPNCTLHRHTTHFPTLQPVGIPNPQTSGYVYVATFQWGQGTQQLIDNVIASNHHLVETKLICRRMLSAKIGSTRNIKRRGKAFVWACCFANVGYVAYFHEYPRTQEGLLHTDLRNRNKWTGVGEWFYLGQQDRSDIEGRFNRKVSEIWKRVTESVNCVDRFQINTMIDRGLVTRDEL
eukprot:CAMPEP_0181088938 /NCGR_PEP_ID=MMETSP1071-20121207/7044_1 /TAXON_ID=35127 /ORGANISM="Thalassiosira sp., Strain NH16" /LENGTH=282 /DNA_ID=CAMNT_0023170869 /DNA_START=172 /DNA_END=1017 /DNA_ORIENTATION=+